MKDTLSNIEQKITKLKQRKEKLQTQQAIVFLKESQKILGEKFSPELALSVLSHSWKSSSNSQKNEWEKEANSSDQTGEHDGGNKEKSSFRRFSKRDQEKNQQAAEENT